MMKFLAALAVACFVSPAFASYDAATDTKCYQLSREWGAWSDTSETLCVQGRFAEGADLSRVTLVLASGSTAEVPSQPVAVFQMSLLRQARCVDCNMDVYGLLSPTDSSVSYLEVSFNGTVHYDTKKEAGTVEFGPTKFYYRDL